MQFLVAINQAKALEWGLNAQQAMLFAFLHQVPTWARARQIDGRTFFNISKSKIVEELPLLTDKQDTAYRLMKQLAALDLIEMTSCDNRTYMRLTEKGVTWNRHAGSEKNPTPAKPDNDQGSEKNPTSENSPSQVGNISEPGSEKSPTNQGTKYPDTKYPEHTLRGDIFAQAANRTDDGTPLPTSERQFGMTLDWEPPTDLFAARCLNAALPSNTTYAQHQLAHFRGHYADTPARYTEGQWVSKFVEWIRRDQRQQAAQPQQATGGARHGTRQQRTPARHRSAAEARAEAEARASGGSGNVYDGECMPGR